MDDKATLTVIEVAKKLGIGRDNAYRAVKDGTIPSLRIGQRIVVSKVVIDRMLAGGAA